MSAKPKLVFLVVMLLLWKGTVAAAWTAFGRYDHIPGTQGTAPLHLATNLLPPTPSSACSQMLVFLHPRCSCSAATLDQLHLIVQ